MDEFSKQLLGLINAKGEQSLKDYNPQDKSQRLMILGIMVSVFCEWNGNEIMESFAESLEDSNFHDKATLVREWME